MTERGNWTRFGNSIYIVERSEAKIFISNSALESLEQQLFLKKALNSHFSETSF